MDTNLIKPESVDITQLLGIDGADLQLKNEGSSAVPKPPIVPQAAHRKASKPLAKSSKTSKSAAGPADPDPDLTLGMAAVPASYWDCRPLETTRDRSRRCVLRVFKYQIGMFHSPRCFGLADGISAGLAGAEVALGSSVWANFFTHCCDAQMVLE